MRPTDGGGSTGALADPIRTPGIDAGAEKAPIDRRIAQRLA